MAEFTLFPAETGVKLTLGRRVSMIACMRSRLSRAALCSAAALACNGGLQPTTACAGICGTVTYQGSLPDSLKDSTAAVLILAFATFPQSPSDLLLFEPSVAFVDTGGPPRRYVLQVPNGTYEWVLAVWEKKSHTGLSAQNADSLLREVGFYHNPADATPQGSGRVHVTGGGADSINFTIDFTNMHRICDYFPPCPPP